MTESNEARFSIQSPNLTPTANKDLSCLRCRKKKAKCSKTRPTCTRCLRSNQSCEYPDAPPNLSDLSQKVLTLYDSLRELEGEFLVKYMQNMDQVVEPASDTEGEESLLVALDTHEDITIEEPAGWSMSFGPSGLCLQAVTRNLYEYRKFIQTLSQQLARDFGPDYLPKKWDPDAEGYGEEFEQEELDEDEYLLTVPISSLMTLLLANPSVEQYKTCGIMPIFVEMHKTHMVQHLQLRYYHLGEGQHHLILIMLHLQPFLQSCFSSSSPLSDICIMTAYIASICLLPPIPNVMLPPLSDFVWKECISDLSLRLMDLILTQSDQVSSFPIILCILLLAWYQVEINKARNDVWIELALRIVYQHQEHITELIPLLIYLDAYSSIFQSRKSVYPLEEDMNVNFQITTELQLGIILEARLMKLLRKVLSLFYQVEPVDEEVEEYRKIDVDEVLDLVKQVEQWENELPEWAKWDSKDEAQEKLKMHMHMIYNLLKILLFRPFTRTGDEQTYTKTTFLDMSMISADKLSICLIYNQHEKNWTKASKNLIKDVVNRLKSMFDQDEHIVKQIELILNKI